MTEAEPAYSRQSTAQQLSGAPAVYQRSTSMHTSRPAAAAAMRSPPGTMDLPPRFRCCELCVKVLSQLVALEPDVMPMLIKQGACRLPPRPANELEQASRRS